MKPTPLGIASLGSITRVIDGDTVEVKIERTVRVRLLDCWAPELHRGDEAERAAGRRSKENLEALLPVGAPIQVHLSAGDDPEALGDAFTLSRVLGRIWPFRDGSPDSIDVSTRQVTGGFAKATKE